MSPIQAVSHRFTCADDGHMVALRIRWDIDDIRVTGFCDRCHALFIPGLTFTGNYPGLKKILDFAEGCAWLPVMEEIPE